MHGRAGSTNPKFESVPSRPGARAGRDVATLGAMRIIAGEFGGRRIEGPPGSGTRPMLDRVREALFSTLGVGVEDTVVLDLFAGTGSLGLEAISRGASRVRCVERHGRTLAILSSNAEILDCAGRVEATGGDALSPVTWERSDGALYDLVFFDPPYPLWRDPKMRRRLDRALAALVEEFTTEGAWLVVHVPRTALSAKDFPAAWEPECRVYGTTALWYLQTPAATAPEADAQSGESISEAGARPGGES